MKLSMLYELDSKLDSDINSSISGSDSGTNTAGEDDLDSGIENIVSNHRQQAKDLKIDPSDDIEDLYDKYKSQMEKMRQQRLNIKSAVDKATKQQHEFSNTLAAASKDLNQI